MGKHQIVGCPLRKITAQSLEYIKFYRMFERKEYPNPGQWFQQPLKYLSAMTHIGNVIERSEEEKRENARKTRIRS